ncbi:MAG: cytochrome c maturation protein CcmE [Acidimicrobiales bacterium]
MGVVVAGAIGFLLFQGLGNAVVYFKTASEAQAARASLGSRDFRIEGTVVKGTLHEVGNSVEFAITQGGVTVPVVNQGSPPQLFQPCIGVVLEGHFQAGTPTFFSNQIMVKHGPVYTAKHPGRLTPDPACAQS